MEERKTYITGTLATCTYPHYPPWSFTIGHRNLI